MKKPPRARWLFRPTPPNGQSLASLKNALGSLELGSPSLRLGLNLVRFVLSAAGTDSHGSLSREEPVRRWLSSL